MILPFTQAKMAGRIAVQQYKIAVKLGDPFVIMRCQLYFSISLIQREKLRAAKCIIEQVFRTMKHYPKEKQDQRIVFMCQGIWAKLRYVWQIKKFTAKSQVFQICYHCK